MRSLIIFLFVVISVSAIMAQDPPAKPPNSLDAVKPKAPDQPPKSKGPDQASKSPEVSHLKQNFPTPIRVKITPIFNL